MADQQKIHPVQEDIEAQHNPTAPLVSRDTSKSDRGDPAAAVTTADAASPFQRTIPVMHSKPPNKRKRNCFCKCMCWSFCLLLILIIAIAATVGILWLAFKPKLPKFSVDRMQISDFTLSNNASLAATFNVTITARNPNEKIGIYYEGGSRISVYYTDTKLCEGSLPKFYQGHENTTVLNIPLTGETENATALANTLQEEQQRTGNVPLNLRVKQPVRIKLGKLKLMKVNFRVRCRIVVNSLNPTDNSIRIQNSSCKFRFRL